MSISTCLEVCVDEICHTVGCSSSAVQQPNETAFSVMNEDALNSTLLNCKERVMLHIDEVPFSVCLVIIFILVLLFTIYAIKKK